MEINPYKNNSLNSFDMNMFKGTSFNPNLGIHQGSGVFNQSSLFFNNQNQDSQVNFNLPLNNQNLETNLIINQQVSKKEEKPSNSLYKKLYNKNQSGLANDSNADSIFK